MMSISVPMALAQDANLVLVIAATLSGGVFGDHCSPISDTTIISSMASACDHIDHVRTQLPYALLAGVISIMLFLIMGYALP
jgi:Na+/H+ antiporter NhaC